MPSPSLLIPWSKVASFLLLGGALAWAIKLGVIISTNGRIIETGAAAFLMKAGIILLAVGSTGIGYRLTLNRSVFIKAVAVVLSPVVTFAVFLLFAKAVTPLVTRAVEKINVWYAEQEAPIALAVIFFLIVGLLLLRSHRSVTRSRDGVVQTDVKG